MVRRQSVWLAVLAASALAVSTLVVWPVLRGSIQGAAASQCSIQPSSLGQWVSIPGGGFAMGRQPRYPEEGPEKTVFVSPFQLLAHEVTNTEFEAFVRATGYVTEAERNQGSAQFNAQGTSAGPAPWWSMDTGATWRTPEGQNADPSTHASAHPLHPVVHVSLNDAKAYAAWAGGRIPSEVEWEYAASLGLPDPSNTESGMQGPDGHWRANVWTGLFPVVNSAADGHEKTAPVGCFAPSRVGTFDMIGNVWEWTDSAALVDGSRYTIKGGSFLCGANYCQRYRPAARESLEPNFSARHLGFRIVRPAAQ